MIRRKAERLMKGTYLISSPEDTYLIVATDWWWEVMDSDGNVESRWDTLREAKAHVYNK